MNPNIAAIITEQAIAQSHAIQWHDWQAFMADAMEAERPLAEPTQEP